MLDVYVFEEKDSGDFTVLLEHYQTHENSRKLANYSVFESGGKTGICMNFW